MIGEIPVQFKIEWDNFDGKPFTNDRNCLACHPISRIDYYAKVSEVAGKLQDVLFIISKNITQNNLTELLPAWRMILPCQFCNTVYSCLKTDRNSLFPAYFKSVIFG